MTHFGHNDWGDTHFDHNDWSLEKTVNFGSPGISYRVKCLCWPWSFPLQTLDKIDDKNKTSHQNQVRKNDAFWPSLNFILDFVREDWGVCSTYTKSWHLLWFVFISNISCQQLSSHRGWLTLVMFCNWHRGVMRETPSNRGLLLCYATHLLRIFPPLFPFFCVISSDREVPKITTKLFKLYSTPGFLYTRFMAKLGWRFFRYQ